LKEATADLISNAGGYANAPNYCRVTKKTLERYADPDYHDTFMPADVIEALELVASHPFVTEHLAESARCHLFPDPKSEATKSELHLNLAKTADYASQLFRDWAEAIGNDGVVDSEEAKALLQHADHLIRTLLIMKRNLITRMNDPDAIRAFEKRTQREKNPGKPPSKPP
jgi:hypothetical protein